MATRKRRTTSAGFAPAEEIAPTHEEMLEITEERVEEEQEEPIEVFLAASLADTFDAIQKAEEESGTGDFFEPTTTPVVNHPPAQRSGRKILSVPSMDTNNSRKKTFHSDVSG